MDKQDKAQAREVHWSPNPQGTLHEFVHHFILLLPSALAILQLCPELCVRITKVSTGFKMLVTPHLECVLFFFFSLSHSSYVGRPPTFDK